VIDAKKLNALVNFFFNYVGRIELPKLKNFMLISQI
jgi:hypothetical protein